MAHSYGKNPNAAAEEKAVIQGEQYRISVLTERMLRVEYSPKGEFVDAETQTVLNRKFPVPEYKVYETEDSIQVVTKYLILDYRKNQAFSNTTLSIQMIGNPYLRKSGTWFYGDKGLESMGNLKGTASTLDNAVGDTYYVDSKDENKVWGEPGEKVPMCEGLMSKNGFTVIDDSRSLVFDEEGWVHPAPEGHQDIYFLNYGRDYKGILKIFYQLTGKTPLLPRYALGNWWSRFHKYTQEEYLELLKKFREEGIPISVGVLDMDWHYVDIDPKYGKGWTGYTWNKELFPDPEAMMKEIHENDMHFSLNVHPADGVRAHEEMYEEMAKELGVDYENEIPIPFDVTSPAFFKAYFKYLHHPNEKKGVDFWWIDWQQGNTSKIPGYDPLWMLNHYHYVDNAKDGKRPMDFSRYAGLGSHRYPIGFSGSTFITWESLDFQPYFTANATNVGYGWWSHDIGGHRNGYRNDELTTRWVQFGVFSPIMRLHSSDEVFTGKEPWKFGMEAEKTMRFFLQLRHRLLPYTYTMNYRFHVEDTPLVEPLYYENPDYEEAYHHPNEYYFGTELLVHPITSEMAKESKTGKVKTYLPEGKYFDVFTGLHYEGNRTLEMHRTIDSIPVLAKEGAILPLQAADTVSSDTANPKDMELRIFCGKSHTFTMYEDDGETLQFENGDAVFTDYELLWQEKKTFVIHPAKGNVHLIPEKRNYKLVFYGIAEDAVSKVFLDGVEKPYEQTYDREKHLLTLEIMDCPVQKKLEVFLKAETEILKNNLEAYAYRILNRAQIPFVVKEKLYKELCAKKEVALKLSTMQTMILSENMKSVISELLLA